MYKHKIRFGKVRKLNKCDSPCGFRKHDLSWVSFRATLLDATIVKENHKIIY